MAGKSWTRTPMASAIALMMAGATATEQGQKQYDALVSRTGSRSIAGLSGPGGLNLYSPKAAVHLSGLSNYLRYESTMSGRVRETAILTTAREMDNQFEWFAHEAVALREGLPPTVIDVIKHRRPVVDLPPADAAIIELGRHPNHRLTCRSPQT